MRQLHEQALGAIVIASLLSIGLATSDDPELARWCCGMILAPNEAVSPITVNRVEWSASGDRLLCLTRGGRSALPSVFVFDVSPRPRTRAVWMDTDNESLSHASLSPDGRSIIMATQDGELRMIDLESSTRIDVARTDDGSPLVVTCASPEGSLVAAATSAGEIFVYSLAGAPRLRMHATRHSAVKELRFSADSRSLLGTRTDGSVTLWSAVTGQPIRELWGGESAPTSAAFLAESHILCFPHQRSFQLWNPISGAITACGLDTTSKTIGHLTLDATREGRFVALGSSHDHRIRVWDMTQRRMIREFVNPVAIRHLCFSPRGGQVAVAGRERRIRIYDVTRPGGEVESIDVGKYLGI